MFAVAVQAQPGGGPSIAGRISGVIIDSLTKQPVDYATISLGRSGSTKNTNGALTDEKGAFKIDKVSPGSYRLTITFMGYKTKVIDPVKTTLEKPDNNLGRIVLSPNSQMLNAVVIEGQAAVIENKVDKMVYNAEKDATVSGGNAGDVLRKVPMVSVDHDGNVSLRGSQNVKILINGKPSGAVASSVADAMKMLPADQIKSVEVITSPSAKYDAEGTGGIINIITKKKEMSGVSGSISGGLGTRQNNGNGNLNINHNRLSISGNFGGNLTWPQNSSIVYSSLNPAAGIENSQIGESETKRYGFMSSGNVSYDFNNYNSISSGIRFNQGQFQTDGSSFNRRITNGTTEEYDQENLSKTLFGGFDWNADYTRKFKKQGHEVTLAGQWSQGKNTTDFSSFYTPLTVQHKNQLGDNEALNDEYTVQADYSLPITDKIKLETGAKTIMRKINSDYTVSILNPNASEYVIDNATSNNYDYNQDVYSGYAVLTLQLKNNYGLQLGGRLENTKIDGSAGNLNASLEPFSNSYTNFIPNVSLTKTIKAHTLRLSYNKRIQRPSLQFLNPFRNTSNLLYQSQGNPYLSPEVSQSVEFNYSTFIKTSVINASLYFRHTDNVIESFLKPDTYTITNADGTTETIPVSLTTFNNIGSNNSIGGSFFGSISPIKNVTLRGNINLYSYSPVASTQFEQQEEKTYLMYNAFVSGSFTLPKGFVSETFMIINAPRRTFQGRNPAFNMWVLSLNKEILKKKGKIGINVIDPFNERKNFKSAINAGSLVQNSNFSMPFRSVGVNFSWQFGKMNFNPQQQQRKKRGVNNDDLKQGDAQGGQGM